MKTVVMLGDSIRMSYWKRAAELLSDLCTVIAPDSNCAYTLYTLRHVRGWFRDWGLEKVDLIHWNNGIWDHHRNAEDLEPLSSPEQYLLQNRRLYGQLARSSDNLIWATTIPAGLRYSYDPHGLTGIPREAWNEEIRSYNALLSAWLKDRGAGINDLYALIAANPDYVGEDGIHLTEEGVEAAARQTADAVRQALS